MTDSSLSSVCAGTSFGLNVEYLRELTEEFTFSQIINLSIAHPDIVYLLEDRVKVELVFNGTWHYVSKAGKSSEQLRLQVRSLLTHERDGAKASLDIQELLKHLFPDKVMIRDISSKVKLSNVAMFINPPMASEERIFWFQNNGQLKDFLKVINLDETCEFFVCCNDNWVSVNSQTTPVNPFRRAIISAFSGDSYECAICFEELSASRPVTCSKCISHFCQSCASACINEAQELNCPCCRQSTKLVKHDKLMQGVQMRESLVEELKKVPNGNSIKEMFEKFTMQMLQPNPSRDSLLKQAKQLSALLKQAQAQTSSAQN